MFKVRENISDIENKYSFSKQILIYTALFCIAAIGVYFWFIAYDRTMIINRVANNDGFAQQYMTYAKIKHMLQDMFSAGAFSWWSWDIGLGGDIFNYFRNRIMNPFTYFVAAFPEEYLDIGYSVMVVLKQYCTGIAFIIFAKKINMSALQNIVGGLCYAFSGYMIMETLNEPGFTNAAIIFPILVLGIERLIETKKPILFIVMVATFLAITTTFSYIAGIATILYYLVRYFHYYPKWNAGEFLKAFGMFILYGIIGLLLASPFLVVYVMSISNTSTGSAYDSYSLYTIKEYLALASGFFKLRVLSTPCSYYFVPSICIALVPMIIKNLKKKSTSAILSIFLFVASLLPITGSIFNGLSYSVGRWYFVLIFFVVWAAVECIDENTLKNKRDYITMLIWMICLGVWNVIICYKWLHVIDDNAVYCTIFGCAFAVVILGALYIKQNKAWLFTDIKKRNLCLNGVVVLALVGSIICVGWMRFYPGIQDDIYEYMAVGDAQKTLQTSTQRAGVELQDQDKTFYRIDNGDGYYDSQSLSASVNENIYFGNRSIYSYFSILDYDWINFHKTMGNNSGYSTRTCVFSNDNRAGLDLLLGVKYFLGDNEDKEYSTSQYAAYGFEPETTIDGVEILKNKYYIGAGATYSKYITASELDKYSPLEREQIMLQAAVVPDDEADKLVNVKHADKSELQTSVDELEYELINKNNIELTDDTMTVCAEGSFDIKTEAVKNQQIVISFEGLERRKNTFDEENALAGVTSDRNGAALKIESQSFRDNERVSITATCGDVVKTAVYRHGGSTGIADISDFNINLGYYENFDGKIHVQLSEVGYYTYEDIKVYAVPMDIYETNAGTLQANKLNVTEFTNDMISGTINAQENSVLYFSVLDDSGWNVYVDGKSVEKIADTNIAFTGVEVSEGQHEIVLKYKPTWLKPGVIGFVIGLIMLIGVIVLRKRKNDRDL